MAQNKYDKYRDKAVYTSGGWQEFVTYPKQKNHLATVIFCFLFIIIVLVSIYGYFTLVGY